MRKKRGWRIDREYQRAEAKFRESGDIRYAALCIGEWYARSIHENEELILPKYPPMWALDACRALREKSEFEIEPVINPTQGGRPQRIDYERINRVARLHYDGSSLSPYDLFKKVLDEDGVKPGGLYEAALRRLLNYYGKFERDPDAGILNRHVDRIARREAVRRGFGQSLRNPLSDPMECSPKE